MKRLLLTTIISFTSIFGLFGGENAKIENNSINYTGDGSIILTFKATSSDIMVIKHDIEYNTTEFEIQEVKQNSYFNYEYKDATIDENIVNKTILLDSEFAFDSVEYMQLTLKPKKNIDSGKIVIKNIEIANSDHKMLKPNGTQLTILLDEDEEESTSLRELGGIKWEGSFAHEKELFSFSILKKKVSFVYSISLSDGKIKNVLYVKNLQLYIYMVMLIVQNVVKK